MVVVVCFYVYDIILSFVYHAFDVACERSFLFAVGQVYLVEINGNAYRFSFEFGLYAVYRDYVVRRVVYAVFEKRFGVEFVS